MAKYSGLRIKNPLISSDLMAERMKGRKIIKIRNVGSSVIDGDVPGDWVLIGVLVDKLPPRDDKRGKRYVIWKLSDLSSQTAIISLFLFGAAFQSHWKTSVGSVVAILNPDIVPNKEGGTSVVKKSSVAVSISNDKKMMLMGMSQDYTLCKGVTKAGKKCTNFASVSDGGYCDYHINKAFESSRSNRMELQTGYGPSINRGKLKDKLFAKSKTEYFYYGGETFAVAPNSKEAAGSSAGSSSRLFAPGARASAAQLVSDLKSQQLQNTGPNPSTSMRTATLLAKPNPVMGAQKLDTFGQRMLIESKRKKEVKPKGGELGKVMPLTAAEMLQNYRDERPCLARGSGPGKMVELSSRPQSAAKRKAAAILRQSQSESSEHKRKRLLDRVEQCRAAEEKNEEENDDERLKKKPRKISLDMDKILNAKSSHSWLSDEVDLERENEYFDKLEKKECIESKKERVTQLTVSAVYCKICNYTAESPGELCTKQGHHLSRVKSIKKAFVCSHCNQKTFEYDVRWPVRPCSKCGSIKYNPASMYYIRKGPTLPTEELLLRGVEEKFLS